MQNNLNNIIKSVLVRQASTIANYAENCGSEISDAVKLITKNQGPVIISGVGKSGHIANKIASTMRSLGKPAAFLHAAEASHGDLGIIHHNSTVVVLSNSGETTELSDLLHYCRNQNIDVISMTSNPESTLAKFSKVVLSYGKVDEGCINGLAPTTSTTMCLAIGDAIAVGVSHQLKIQPEDFRKWHPGGKLGNRLNYVKDVMSTGRQLPLIAPGESITNALLTMAGKSLGCVIITENDKVLGILTDGDMRRHAGSLSTVSLLSIATKKPIYISEDTLAADAAEIMAKAGITTCLVGKAGSPIKGCVHIHDCLRPRQNS